MIENLEEYNTQKPPLRLKEYGRNIQKIVEHIQEIENREERTHNAHTLVKLMRQITPSIRDAKEPEDYQNKLWDDLYIMASFDLDVESPFPLPEKTILGRKPKPLEYQNNKIRHRHYGRNIELLIKKVFKIEDMEDKYFAISEIAKLMKNFYYTWHKDNLEDEVMIKHIQEIGNDKLESEIIDRLIAESVLGGNHNHSNHNQNNRRSRGGNKNSRGNSTRRHTNKGKRRNK